MENVTVTALRTDLYSVVSEVATYNTVYNVNSKDGNVVVISRQEYENLKEMEYFNRHPQLTKELIEAKNAPDEDFISEEDFQW